MTRVADYVIERLHEEGVEHIYLVTGRGILYLSDAVARHNDMKGISVHHEQAAAYAATASAQYTGKIGACLVSTGCASTNAITGLLCAWQDSVPCVFISGNHILEETTRYTGIPIRTFGQQETDIISVVEPLTKYAVMITDPKRIAYEMDKAFYLAKQGRKGPVWIDIPLDIQDGRIDSQNLEHFVPQPEDVSLSKEDVEYVRQAIEQSKRPVILIGSGVHAAGAKQELLELLECCPIPVTYAASAPDTYGAGEKLSIGAVSAMGGSRAGNFAVQNADLLLVLGCSLSSMITSAQYDKFARKARIIVVDIDRMQHNKQTIQIDRLITADIREFLTLLNTKTGKCQFNNWVEKCLHWKQIFPICEQEHRMQGKVDLYEISEAMTNVIPKSGVLCTDAGLEELILPSNIRFQGEQRCIHPSSQGAMGYAIPATIGAYYASGESVVAVVGDGSIMMNLQELQTISFHKLPIKIFVINNNGYAIIRKRQKDLFRKRTIGNDPSDGVGIPDFQKVAECFGLAYTLIEDSNSLENKIEEVLKLDGPVLCEVMAVENQGYLHSSYAKTLEGKMVHRPLEDQSPYLDRELFLSEMVIEPIDQ